MPVLIRPLVSTLVVGLLMIYVIGEPVTYINNAMISMLQGMGQTNAILLGPVSYTHLTLPTIYSV